MDYRTKLSLLAGAYCRETGRSEARVANLAGRDGKFFERIKSGRTCSVDTLHHVIQWFSENWPPGIAWPDGIERPSTPTKARPPRARRVA